MSCGIILLAAGAGNRFGSDKLKACAGEKTMYQIALERLSQLAVSGYVQKKDIIVVSKDQTILAEAETLGFIPVENPAPSLGISRSIRLGLRALTLGMTGPASPCSMAAGLTQSVCEAVMFMVCDQPYLTTESAGAMLEAWEEKPSGILRASCKGQQGNPVIFHKSYFMELMSLYGDEGGRAVAAMHAEDVRYFEISDPQELKDIDYPSDLSYNGQIL